MAFEVEKRQLLPACYDLLASEARIAYLVAIAKDEIPQESWFQLGRAPMAQDGMVGLLSWTGTMFEYLMPTLWTRIHPNTLLERAATVAVTAQQADAAEKSVPWGISESACARMDEWFMNTNYPFGSSAIGNPETGASGSVISPYSSVLSFSVDPQGALRNRRQMQRQRWMGLYGFYESLDFSLSRGRMQSRRPQLVRCWMAHHQGMSLLSIANFLHYFLAGTKLVSESHRRVRATELLLQEKPVGHLHALKDGAKAA